MLRGVRNRSTYAYVVPPQDPPQRPGPTTGGVAGDLLFGGATLPTMKITALMRDLTDDVPDAVHATRRAAVATEEAAREVKVAAAAVAALATVALAVLGLLLAEHLAAKLFPPVPA